MSKYESYSSMTKEFGGQREADQDAVLDDDQASTPADDTEFDDEWEYLYDEIDFENQRSKRIKSDKKNNISW